MVLEVSSQDVSSSEQRRLLPLTSGEFVDAVGIQMTKSSYYYSSAHSQMFRLILAFFAHLWTPSQGPGHRQVLMLDDVQRSRRRMSALPSKAAFRN